jgi:hypothetical protein
MGDFIAQSPWSSKPSLKRWGFSSQMDFGLVQKGACWAQVAHICNLTIWEVEIRRIVDGGQPRQIVHEIPISKIARTKWTGDMV